MIAGLFICKFIIREHNLESLSLAYNEVHLYLQMDKIRLSCTAQPRRTTAEQEVLALFAPLRKLIVTHLLEKKSAASSKRPSLPSGAIRVNTSCSASVLLGTAALSSKLELVLRSTWEVLNLPNKDSISVGRAKQ